MTVWPSLSATGFGRFWGRLFAFDYGPRIFGVPVTIGRLFALASIPFMLALYFLMRLPRFPGVIIGIKNPWCWQYRLTNRRVIMENPFGGEIKSVALDRFDAIDVVVEPGQALVQGGRPGVSPGQGRDVSHLGRAAAGNVPPHLHQVADVVRGREEGPRNGRGGLSFSAASVFAAALPSRRLCPSSTRSSSSPLLTTISRGSIETILPSNSPTFTASPSNSRSVSFVVRTWIQAW